MTWQAMEKKKRKEGKQNTTSNHKITTSHIKSNQQNPLTQQNQNEITMKKICGQTHY